MALPRLLDNTELDDTDTLTEDAALAVVRAICFKTGPPRRIGVELEWLVGDPRRPDRPVARERLTAAFDGATDLPFSCSVTAEPGGQLELSSAAADSLQGCIEATLADLALLRGHLAGLGLSLLGLGHDPVHSPRRVLDHPRYAAMEAYFDRGWPSGRWMMCSTASVQVCLDAGTLEPGPAALRRRWRLAHRLGPVLVAAFANSPFSRSRPTGWRSTRQAVWTALDPGRTLAPPHGPDPAADWASYALDAPVLCVRHDGRPWTAPPGFSFRDWIRTGHPRPPRVDDLRYHLTTLFPPVRPHGHLELRMIDAQPGTDGWIVPLAVTTALFDDPFACESAWRAVRALPDSNGPLRAPQHPLWLAAARHGLAVPELRTAAVGCFTAALEALPRLGVDASVTAAVAAFTERYVLRGRCPADDLLEAAQARG